MIYHIYSLQHNSSCSLSSFMKTKTSLSCFLSFSAEVKLDKSDKTECVLVLEEDGTEVDDEEYFQTVPKNTLFMLVYKEETWTKKTPRMR